jgi:asparagine synthase (glutamine-hydrolysing)
MSYPFSGCGIAGGFRFKGNKTVDINKMVKTLHHRGPNDSGVWTNDFISLGHARLSILDLSNKGHQPMIRKTAVLTYNGEVYNFQELKDILILDGVSFESTTDTEVLLYAYLKWGTKMIEKLNGFFAFAIWDEQLQSLFLGVDRLGVKPLFYYKNDDLFCFASEVEALLTSGVVPPIPDLDVIFKSCVISHSLLGGDGTAVKDVTSLTPGHFMEISKDGNMKISKYWDLPDADPSLQNISKEEAISKMKNVVEDAIRLRMISDVPVCSFLSGGIDSSLITAVASEINPISAFCINYGARNSDNEYSEKVANHLGDSRVKFNTVDVRLEEVTVESLSQIVDMSTIQQDARVISVYQNYKAIADNGFKVVLNGQGADEVHAGYAFSSNFQRIYYDITKPEQRPEELLRKTVKGLDLSNLRPDRADEARREVEESMLKRLHRYSNSNSDLEQVSRVLTQLTLRAWFRHEDFYSMRHSVECRVPFSDHRIVELCFKLPFDIHVDMEKSSGKQLLRAISRDHLPEDVVERPKQNFPSGDLNILIEGLKRIIDSNWESILSCDLLQKVFRLDRPKEEVLEWGVDDLWLVVYIWLWNQRLESFSK